MLEDTWLDDVNISSNETSISQDCSDESEGLVNCGSTTAIVAFCLFAALLMFATVFGNLLVTISYWRNRRLQCINNLFLVSLAVSDLVIGAFSMNLYSLYILYGMWPFSPLACDIYLCIDYTVSNASVANLIIISLDRYLSVTRPFTYRRKRTRRKATIAIIAAWILSAILWCPAIVLWPIISKNGRTIPVDHCYVQFLAESKAMTIGTSLVAFYLPVLALIYLYRGIYVETQKCQKYLPAFALSSDSTNMSNEKSDESRFTPLRRGTITQISALLQRNTRACQSSASDEYLPGSFVNRSASVGGEEPTQNELQTSPPRASTDQSSPSLRSSINSPFKNGNNQLSNTISLNQSNFTRAGRILSSVLLVFIITWLPYNILAIFQASCGTDCIPPIAWKISYYLCYLNSTINPILYALCNSAFRITFKQIMACKWNGPFQIESL